MWCLKTTFLIRVHLCPSVVKINHPASGNGSGAMGRFPWPRVAGGGFVSADWRDSAAQKTMKPRLLLRQPNYDQTGNENACQHRAGLSELEICSYVSHE
jgi:hypothetical protein